MKLQLLLITAVLLVLNLCPRAQAEFLFDGFVIPSFDGNANAEYTAWDKFYHATDINYPDVFAPNGIFQSASGAGFTVPAGTAQSAPYADPSAYWHTGNATLQQLNSGGIIASAVTEQNIYSFSGPLSFEVVDSTPYTLGTVVFQFESEGTLVNFDSVRLEYNGGANSLAPKEYVREYQAGSSSFGGLANRNSFQWDVSGLGISDYKIVWDSDVHMSFKLAALDTYDTYSAEVPEARTWTATGAANWSNTGNWAEGTISQTNGNVIFSNTAATTIADTTSRTVGEIRFETDSDVTVNNTASLISNTGIVTESGSTGTYTIGGDYTFGAFNVMDIAAGEVRLDGTVSGDYGMLKTEDGTLVLSGNNSFGSGGTGGLGVQGGVLRIEGTNAYEGITSVSSGDLVLAAAAPEGAVGALGNATTAVQLGGSESQVARLIVDGNHEVARNVNIDSTSVEKALGSINSTVGAVYSGAVSVANTADSVHFFAANSGDQTEFSGAISGGQSGNSLSINANGETGTVTFSGADKSYNSDTTVGGGTVVIDSGTAYNGSGDWTVNAGAQLDVDGILGGSGALYLNGGTVTGSGTIHKAVTVAGGDVLAPGNSPGTLSFGDSQTWGDTGAYLWEINDVDAGNGIGWDVVSITGGLDITATSGAPFEIDLVSLTLADAAGAVHDFNQLANYSWTILETTTGITGFDIGKFDLDSSGFANGYTGTFSIVEAGNSLQLQYTAVPEPSTGLLLMLGLAGLSFIRRK